ncbi:MAG: tetratricopeptide repeat protein [Candidatus Zixiibacteriota bacterium]|nr:MAG: tetratricopeptide repeat protein [candidate division Zixibacteria bacterium]
MKKDIASSLSNLGGIKLVQHQYDDSIALYKESIAIKREIGDWPELARTANNLAVAHFEIGRIAVGQ